MSSGKNDIETLAFWITHPTLLPTQPCALGDISECIFGA